MDTSKIYHDSEGNDVTIYQAVKREPVWAAVRIQEGEKYEKLYNELIMEVSEKYKDETRHETALRYLREKENYSESEQEFKDLF